MARPCTQENSDTAVTQLYSNKYLISYISCAFKRPVMFHKMNVKNGSKNLKRYPQISRRVRDTLARLFFKKLNFILLAQRLALLR